jgi:hypothetical protein
MDSFFCAGCRFQYSLDKAGRITPGAHRDGQPVGFCDVCTREYFGDAQFLDEPAEPALEPEAAPV